MKKILQRAFLFLIVIEILGACSTTPELYTPNNTNDVAKIGVDVKEFSNTNNIDTLIVVYIWGRNNLYVDGLVDVNEMEQSVSNFRAKGHDAVFVFTGMDMPSEYTQNHSTINNIGPGGIFYLQQNSYDFYEHTNANTSLYTVANNTGGDVASERVYYNLDTYPNSADVNAVKDNLNWIKTNFTYQKVVLIAWNHGAGFFPMGENDTLENKTNSLYKSYEPKYVGIDDAYEKSLSAEEFRYAVKSSISNIDVLAFDACLMLQLEEVYSYRTMADWIVGSAAALPTEGYRYDDLVDRVATNIGKQSIAKAIVDSFYEVVYLPTSNNYDFYEVPLLTAITPGAIDKTVELTEDFVTFLDTTGIQGLKEYLHRSRPQSILIPNGYYWLYGLGDFTDLKLRLIGLVNQFPTTFSNTTIINIISSYETEVMSNNNRMYYREKPMFCMMDTIYDYNRTRGTEYKYYDNIGNELFTEHPLIYKLLGNTNYTLNPATKYWYTVYGHETDTNFLRSFWCLSNQEPGDTFETALEISWSNFNVGSCENGDCINEIDMFKLTCTNAGLWSMQLHFHNNLWIYDNNSNCIYSYTADGWEYKNISLNITQGIYFIKFQSARYEIKLLSNNTALFE